MGIGKFYGRAISEAHRTSHRSRIIQTVISYQSLFQLESTLRPRKSSGSIERELRLVDRTNIFVLAKLNKNFSAIEIKINIGYGQTSKKQVAGNYKPKFQPMGRKGMRIMGKLL